MRFSTILFAGAATLLAATTAAPIDVGVETEEYLRDNAVELFGHSYIPTTASTADYVARENATAPQRVKIAPGLKVEFVTRRVCKHADQITFWPNDKQYTHLFVCCEDTRSPAGNNPGVQRIEVSTGNVQTIVYGMDRCDGIRATPWGTVIATEETDDGGAYEIYDPLRTTNEWIANRTTGKIYTAVNGSTSSSAVFKRDALPIMAWEGLTITANGVVYGGDELRPGTGTLDKDGGAMFKFVPTTPYNASAPNCDAPKSISPFVSGKTYALQVSCVESTSSSFPQYGQGCEVGQGAWVEVQPATARRDAFVRGATGYYRPEDLDADPHYTGKGLRFCWTNTGNRASSHFAEVMCVVDETPLGSLSWTFSKNNFTYQSLDGKKPLTANVTRFIEGGRRFNYMDNIAFNPVSNTVAVIEDDTYGEVWDCLPDGADDNLLTDGCIPFLSVVDPEAEPTGFIWDASGIVAYVILQHGECPNALKNYSSNPVDGCTDDLIKITGFKLPTDC